MAPFRLINIHNTQHTTFCYLIMFLIKSKILRTECLLVSAKRTWIVLLVSLFKQTGRAPPLTAHTIITSTVWHPWRTSNGPPEPTAMGPVLGNSVIGLQIPSTHTEGNMQQNKEERNSSSRVCETIVRRRQWKTNIGWKWKFESPICSTLCADKRRGSAGALATTEYSKHKLWARVGQW